MLDSSSSITFLCSPCLRCVSISTIFIFNSLLGKCLGQEISKLAQWKFRPAALPLGLDWSAGCWVKKFGWLVLVDLDLVIYFRIIST